MRRDDDSDWDLDPEEDDAPDPDAWDDDDEPVTVPCPYCREEIHEDAVYCPRCENYISREDAPPSPKPVWLIVGAIVCLVMILMWVLPL